MKRVLVILVLLLLASVQPAFCQKTKGKSKQQLQSEITSLQKEISTANQLLKNLSFGSFAARVKYSNIKLDKETTFPLKITDKMEQMLLK